MSWDVAIIGAGVVGTAIARELAGYQLSCVLLEAADDIGGASRCWLLVSPRTDLRRRADRPHRGNPLKPRKINASNAAPITNGTPDALVEP